MTASRLTTLAILGGLALVLGAGGATIASKQAILDDGRTVLLPLRPVDPRSLMQGDYMVLAYDASVFPPRAVTDTLPLKGTVVLTLDEAGQASFARIDDGLALAQNEARLVYRLRGADGDLRYGAESFFFQEGHADAFADARFGVLKIDGDGNSVLSGLADEDGRLIEPPPSTEE